ncbi:MULTISPECIES: glycosyltransferase family 8 protein [Rhizobium]|uniref:Galactosyl transferase n=2 Tax=Rhizobium TaxID=379 RepID=Q1MDP9_RHIJ3|nr:MULTISPECIES: glycosyltransferase family 8 protein [Rhizobium]QIO68100.1 glycosyltransferase family 8 protein [Rhizobium leguminosarum bv. trifolii]CAK08928.1 galactosyl transferase [Rhizobium johnstonii 3841]MBY5319670.1 glycosyltransferase family 8 protein [Rhizobium leguminosarum]MBY5339972.1 glycosyltransferase family 8 protein [Rhizobium leguminosarum]MBY5373482.1 glycosyltransferase family 8 protein [Rhizobium leguminosarum]
MICGCGLASNQLDIRHQFKSPLREAGILQQSAVIVCSDVNMLPAACCTLLSVKRNLSSATVEFLLLGIDLKPNEIAEVGNFARLHGMAIKVLPYNTPDTALQARGRWSGATLARLYMDLHIPDHVERLLYLDADVLAVAPVDDLFAMDLQDKALAAIDDYVMAFPEKAGARQRKIGMREGGRYFNAGVLLFDWSACRSRGLFARTREIFEERSHLFENNDQDALNVTFDGDWLVLDPRWNTQTGLLPFVGRPAIIHFTGRKKPWQATVPWVHRRMAKRYAEDLANTPWASFCRQPSMTGRIAGFLSHLGKRIGGLARLARTRAYFSNS